MKKNEIVDGGTYLAKVNGKLTRVYVEGRHESYNGKTFYNVVNLATGRRTVFRSAAKFRAAVAV